MPNANIYIGVDLHKKTCYITVMDYDGKIEKQIEISTDRDKVRKFFEKYRKAKVAAGGKLCSVIFAMLADQQPFREFTPTKQR
ncbi:MAG: hypothetical protein U9N04_00005 [Patescibacteria group bacterium]|nr:hypothetical protein [Patescibacteria group bacterium]